MFRQLSSDIHPEPDSYWLVESIVIYSTPNELLKKQFSTVAYFMTVRPRWGRLGLEKIRGGFGILAFVREMTDDAVKVGGRPREIGTGQSNKAWPEET